MPAKPSLDLYAEVRFPDNTGRRWDGRYADTLPRGINFTSGDMEGFKTGGCALSRRIDQDYVDLHLYDDLYFIGADGSIAWEGRIAASPRSMAQAHEIQVDAVGWMAHAKDQGFREIYVDRDFSKWTTRSVQRQANLIGAAIDDQGNVDVQPDASTGQPALRTSIVGTWARAARTEAWYNAQGISLGALYYAWKKSANVGLPDANRAWSALLSTDDIATATDATGNLSAAGPGTGTLTATATGRTFASVLTSYAAAGGAAGRDDTIYWTVLALFGTHSLVKQGTADATNAQGFYVSDIIKDIAARWCPKLNTTGVQQTTWVVPQAAFTDRTKPYDAWLQLNAYHLWRLFVYENKTLYYQPIDLTDYDWEVRTGDQGVTVALQGDSTDDVKNRIAVQYQDLQKGATVTLDPADYAALRDDTATLQANLHGLKVDADVLQLSTPTTNATAQQIGRAALGEFNRPKAPGTITITGHLRDRAGHWQQGWKVRAGDRLILSDHPNSAPRYVTETAWNHDAKTMTITVDGGPRRIDAVLDRLNTALKARNL